MSKQPYFIENAKLISYIMALLALVLFVFASISGGALSVFLHILWVLCLGVGGYLFYEGYCQEQHRVNYFLYDRHRKKRISEDQLTAELVKDNLIHYLSKFTKNPIELWAGFPRALQMQLEAESHFLPLVSYYLLYLMSTFAQDKISQEFFDAEGEVVSIICNALDQAGDTEMAEVIYRLKTEFLRREKNIEPFFTRNQKIFETRMMRYILHHKDDFVVDISSI